MSEHIVSAEDEGIRLDRWFKRHLPGLQHALLEKHLRKGEIRLDGKKVKSSERLLPGQVIRIQAGHETAYSAQPETRLLSPADASLIQKTVLYKDANIIVINKPFGLATQGGSKIHKSVDSMLDALTFDAPGRPKLTHRLDRDTSGCLVLARDARAANILMKSFSGKHIEKTYWAIINGTPEQLSGEINLPLSKKADPKGSGFGRGPEGRDYEVMQVDREEGQYALTQYRVLDMLARKFALVELKPQTGRTHQLRVHMAAIGHPILGDHKYGGGNTDAAALGVENILHLHARRIQIPAFAGGKKIDVTAPLPEHMKNSFRALGLDVPKK